MKVLVACEYSGIVRDAFIKHGHDAISCDLLDTESPGPHYMGDVFDIINNGFDLMIAHPPCTHLAVSGAPHFDLKRKDGRQQQALDFVLRLMNANIERICIENPVSVISTYIKPYDQLINPYEFGDPVEKATCLWLKNLLPLMPTDLVKPEERFYWIDKKTGKQKSVPGWHYKTLRDLPGAENTKARSKARSKFFPGIANAMAKQWGNSTYKQFEFNF